MMRQEQNYSLLPHNTFGIDVKAKHFVEFADETELRSALDVWRASGERMFVIGQGSNLLFTEDFPGWIFHSAIRGIEIGVPPGTQVAVRAGSGEAWDDVVACCLSNGLSGVENLSLIPGEVGASAVQNIGAYGVEVKDVIASVETIDVMTGRKVVFSNAECEYAYRQSICKNRYKGRFVITHVTYHLSRVFEPRVAYGAIREAWESKTAVAKPTPGLMRELIIDIRQKKLPDPVQTGNAGSFFMNPVVSSDVFHRLASIYPDMPHYVISEKEVKIPAGWLIEQCGWRGRSMGRAAVYAQQALVLVNNGGATGNDVLRLCRTIQHDVEDKFGIRIEPEVNIL